MISRDFPTHCNELVLPIFKACMGVKQGDKKQDMINTVLFAIKDYDPDLFGHELHESIKAFYCAGVVMVNQPHRITLDRLLADIIVNCGYLLKDNNKLFPDQWIVNPCGRIRDHYSYSV